MQRVWRYLTDSACLCRVFIFLSVFMPIVTWSEADTKSSPVADLKPSLVAMCMRCHGFSTPSTPATPLAMDGIYPSLNAQHANYMVTQLNDFKANPKKTRHSPTMTPIAKKLSANEIIQLSVYFSYLPPVDSTARDEKRVAIGRQLWRAGEASASIAACLSCHGPDGEGIPPVFPRLKGQSATYTAMQLRAFRSQTRTNDKNTMMQLLTKRMTDEEIHAVAEFAQGLR